MHRQDSASLHRQDDCELLVSVLSVTRLDLTLKPDPDLSMAVVCTRCAVLGFGRVQDARAESIRTEDDIYSGVR